MNKKASKIKVQLEIYQGIQNIFLSWKLQMFMKLV